MPKACTAATTRKHRVQSAMFSPESLTNNALDNQHPTHKQRQQIRTPKGEHCGSYQMRNGQPLTKKRGAGDGAPLRWG